MNKIKEKFTEWLSLIPCEFKTEMIKWTFYILVGSFLMFMAFIVLGLYIKGVGEFYNFLGINPESQVVQCK